ncbi:MAG: helix-turn-helix domain-containing protein [Alphaproteobacteria bacterium]|nr:helix-turn-helix domain-containing protein [Alphaproteobacteria bacterium]
MTLIDTKECAKLLKTDERTLAVWRCTKKVNIPYIKIGSKVLYDLDDLHAFLSQHKVNLEDFNSD